MSRHRGEAGPSRLQLRLESLSAARELAKGRVDQAPLSSVYEVLDHAATRRSLSSGHTVVGVFGPTGSGKSSLLNSLIGSEVARVAARRPTTSEPLAVIWDADGSGPLLDWLQVTQRHVMPAGAPLYPQGAGKAKKNRNDDGGLILLDLPDFDSTERSHRDIVERLAGQVDVLLWVTDPQKYADAALHHGFLRPLASHGAVTLMALNQTDRLSEAELEQVSGSLQNILAADGLKPVAVHSISALTGRGLDVLAAKIRDIAGNRKSAEARLAADIDSAVESLAEFTGPALDPPSKQLRTALAAGLAEAAGADAVIDAVVRSYRRDAHAATGWPVTRWLGRLRADPLRRLNLRREEVDALPGRTSLPAPGPAQRAAADKALRQFADGSAGEVGEPWRSAIQDAARMASPSLLDGLDNAVARTDLRSGSRSWWWSVAGALQWLFLAAAVAGLAWLGVLAGMGFLQFAVPAAPLIEGIPVPTLLAVGGLVGGVVLSLLSAALARFAAQLRGKRVRRRLVASIAEASDTLAAAPVAAEVSRYNDFCAAVKAARASG